MIFHSTKLLDRQSLKGGAINKLQFLEEEKQRIDHELLEVEATNAQSKMSLPTFFNLIGQHRLEDAAKKIILSSETAMSNNQPGGSRRANHPFFRDPANYSYIECARCTLNEIDRVEMEETPLVASIILHSLPQLFPKDVLIDELERQLDSLTRKEIGNDEEAICSGRKPFLDFNICFNDNGSIADTLDSADEEGEEAGAENIGSNKVAIQLQKAKYCIACNSIHCLWASSIDYENALKRREELTHLIVKTKQQHRHCVSSSEVTASTEILRNARLEAQIIDDECKLHCIDMELHKTIQQRTQKYTITRALHNYDCMMLTEDAIYTLEKEHDHLVAKKSALEIIDDILEW